MHEEKTSTDPCIQQCSVHTFKLRERQKIINLQKTKNKIPTANNKQIFNVYYILITQYTWLV